MSASRRKSKGSKAPAPLEEKVSYTASEVEQIVQERIAGLQRDLAAFKRVDSNRKRDEESLKQEKERMGSILTALDTGLSLIDREMTILWVNQKVRDTFPDQEPVGQKCYRLYEGRDTPCEECATRQAFVTGEVTRIEKYIPGTSSAPGRWLLLATQPIRDESGQVLHVLESFTDITPQRQMVEALRESEERYRTLIELSPEPIAVHHQGKVVYANPACATMVGARTPQDLIGKPILQFVHPDDHDLVRERVRRMLAYGETGSLKEERFLALDGHVINVAVVAAPITFENLPAVMVLFQDITERKQAEEALHESEEKFRMLIHSSRDGILLNDEEGAILEWNSGMEGITGIPKEDAVGCTLIQVASRLLMDGVTIEDMEHRILAKIAELNQPVTYSSEIPYVEATIQHLDGSPRFIQAQSFRFTSRGRVLYGAVIRDVTEGKRAELTLKEYANRLKQSNEDLERFAYISSHDLQEPLRAIVSYTQLLERRYKDNLDRDADEYLHYIVDGGKRMQDLIHDLLEFSRVNTKGGKFRTIEANAVVEDTLAALLPQTQAAGVTIIVDPLPAVMADPVQLRQVFQNLISNALKFRKPDVPVEIHISAEQLKDKVEFSVADNGIGIEPQYFEKIFVIFQRLHAMDKYEGTGIGLAIVKRIIDRHGGRIWVESEPGKGSTFHFTIPAAKRD